LQAQIETNGALSRENEKYQAAYKAALKSTEDLIAILRAAAEE
jgi:hypothetical protein